MAAVFDQSYAFGRYGLPEAWPASARFKFCIGLKQRESAHNAVVAAGLLFIPIDSSEGRFGAGTAGYFKLLRCEAGS